MRGGGSQSATNFVMRSHVTPPFWLRRGKEFVREPLLGMVDAASHAPRQRWLGQSRVRHPRCPPGGAGFILVEMAWTSGNGGFPTLLPFPAHRLKITSSSLVKIVEAAISTCPPFPPPTGDRPALDMAGQPRP
jgi:hypothetical protein